MREGASFGGTCGEPGRRQSSAQPEVLPGEPGLDVLLGHPSLRCAYRDRVIEHRDRRRLAHPEVALLVREALGGHPDTFWPGYTNAINDTNTPIPQLTNSHLHDPTHPAPGADR